MAGCLDLATPVSSAFSAIAGGSKGSNELIAFMMWFYSAWNILLTDFPFYDVGKKDGRKCSVLFHNFH